MPRTLAFVALVLAPFGCTYDKSVEPVPIGPAPTHAGSFLLTLTTPNTGDAALFFELRGPRITRVRPLNPATKLFVDSGSAIRGAIFGPLTGGALATFEVPDTTRRADYTASVLDVAGPDNNLRSSLTGYSLSVAR